MIFQSISKIFTLCNVISLKSMCFNVCVKQKRSNRFVVYRILCMFLLLCKPLYIHFKCESDCNIELLYLKIGVDQSWHKIIDIVRFFLLY